MYFAPWAPHILASGSDDTTVRIWNIFGGELEEQPKDSLLQSQNFPQADADEGTVLLAVLCGSGIGGHKAAICDIVSVCVLSVFRLESVHADPRHFIPFIARLPQAGLTTL
jgi:hypothetical protein